MWVDRKKDIKTRSCVTYKDVIVLTFAVLMMDLNKENIIKRTKIPIPQEPLPKIPSILLVKKDVRCPLKNISHIETANTNVASVVKCPLKIDTTHVTVRRTEELDWDYKVFRDEKAASSNIGAGPPKNKEANITPLKSHLTVNRIKNIKRSLKRPHSRELQGISPTANEKNTEGNFKRQLSFKTVDKKLDTTSTLAPVTSLTEDYTADVHAYMLRAERRGAVPRIESLARSHVMNWLINVNGTFHRNAAVVQSAQQFFDTLTSTHRVHIDHVQLVAAACYWVAQKSAGPLLQARKLVKCSSDAFTVGKLVAAEKAVLRILKFPTLPVVPQDFVSYLCWSCDPRPEEVEAAATFLIMAALVVDKGLCDQYPSVIAAAAVRNAMALLGRQLAKLCSNAVYRASEIKAKNFGSICSLLTRAVCLVSSPLCRFTAPVEKYGTSAHFVAQRIVNGSMEIHRTEKLMDHPIFSKK